MNREDLRYISDPMLWVSFLCPLKRASPTGTGREFAYLQGDGPILYHGNMWNPKEDDRKEVFASYKDIIDAGWEVD